MSDSLWSHGLQPTRLLCLWTSPGKNTGVGCHFLLQGIFPSKGSKPCLSHCKQILYHLSHEEALLAIVNKLIWASCFLVFLPMKCGWYLSHKEDIGFCKLLGMMTVHGTWSILNVWLCASVCLLCLTLCDPMDCSLPGSSVHGIVWARLLEWLATSHSRGSSRPRDWDDVSCICCTGRWVLCSWCVLGSPYSVNNSCY